jgi:hypothetical protein
MFLPRELRNGINDVLFGIFGSDLVWCGCIIVSIFGDFGFRGNLNGSDFPRGLPQSYPPGALGDVKHSHNLEFETPHFASNSGLTVKQGLPLVPAIAINCGYAQWIILRLTAVLIPIIIIISRIRIPRLWNPFNRLIIMINIQPLCL